MPIGTCPVCYSRDTKGRDCEHARCRRGRAPGTAAGVSAPGSGDIARLCVKGKTLLIIKRRISPAFALGLKHCQS